MSGLKRWWRYDTIAWLSFSFDHELGEDRIEDSQLTIEFLGRYKPLEIERLSHGAARGRLTPPRSDNAYYVPHDGHTGAPPAGPTRHGEAGRTTGEGWEGDKGVWAILEGKGPHGMPRFHAYK